MFCNIGHNKQVILKFRSLPRFYCFVLLSHIAAHQRNFQMSIFNTENFHSLSNAVKNPSRILPKSSRGISLVILPQSFQVFNNVLLISSWIICSRTSLPVFTKFLLGYIISFTRLVVIIQHIFPKVSDLSRIFLEKSQSNCFKKSVEDFYQRML